MTSAYLHRLAAGVGATMLLVVTAAPALAQQPKYKPLVVRAPDGVTVSFITSLSPLAGVTVKTSEPEKFQPLVRNAAIQQGLDVTIIDALVATLPPDFPEGQSFLFAAITAAGTQNLVAPLAIAEFTFSP